MTKEELQKRYEEQSAAAKAQLKALIDRRNDELHQIKDAGARQQENATREYFQQKREHLANMRWLKERLETVAKLPNSDNACDHWRMKIQQEQEEIDRIKTGYQAEMRIIKADIRRRLSAVRVGYDQEIQDQKALLSSLRTAFYQRLAEILTEEH